MQCRMDECIFSKPFLDNQSLVTIPSVKIGSSIIIIVKVIPGVVPFPAEKERFPLPVLPGLQQAPGPCSARHDSQNVKNTTKQTLVVLSRAHCPSDGTWPKATNK
ncbi:unnamed protein product, partial [Ectocarpus sp. 8 AP-2014]